MADILGLLQNAHLIILQQNIFSQKEYLLFYDITRCLSLDSATDFACPTKQVNSKEYNDNVFQKKYGLTLIVDDSILISHIFQVCVAKCPSKTEVLTSGNKDDFKPFLAVHEIQCKAMIRLETSICEESTPVANYGVTPSQEV